LAYVVEEFTIQAARY